MAEINSLKKKKLIWAVFILFFLISLSLLCFSGITPQKEEASPDPSGTWTGDFSFDFDGEIVPGNLTLYFQKNGTFWKGKVEVSTKGVTGSEEFFDLKIKKHCFKLEIPMSGDTVLKISALAAKRHIQGSFFITIKDNCVGKSSFILRRQPGLLTVFWALAGQRPDPNFHPDISDPAYPLGMGPLVLIDEAHHNFHTMKGSYKGFSDLLIRDGHIVLANRSPLSFDSLQEVDILVISNSLSKENEEKWATPIFPAFTKEEVAAVEKWVRKGGALMLIADHFPFPGAVENLAAAFGIEWSNGYVALEKGGSIVFRKQDGTLPSHAILEGLNENEKVETVATFTGSAFRGGDNLQSLLLLPPGAYSYLPEQAGRIQKETPKIPAAGWLQGGVLHYGKGRAAFFGEAAMFSAQIAGLPGKPMGMNDPGAAENSRFLLNIFHWLSGLFSPE